MEDKTLSGCIDRGLEWLLLEAAAEELAALMEEKGVRLTKEDALSMCRSALHNKGRQCSFEDGCFLQSDEDMTFVRLSKADLRRFSEKLELRIKRIRTTENVGSAAETIACSRLEKMEDCWPEISAERDARMRDFVQEVDSFWHDSVEYLRLMCGLFFEQGEQIVQHACKNDSADWRWSCKAASLLRARACQVLSEITVLIKCGFPEAALARWRTLHELAVTSLLIFDREEGEGEGLAERFILHDIVEINRAQIAHNEHCQKLQMSPISDEERSQVEKEVNGLCDRFGKNFGNRYGWASEVTGSARPNFSMLEKAVGLDYLRPYYSYASYGVHSNSRGLIVRPSQPSYTDELIAGPSVFGLTDAIRLTAQSIVQLLRVVVQRWPDFDSLVVLKMLEKLQNKVNEGLSSVPQELA